MKKILFTIIAVTIATLCLFQSCNKKEVFENLPKKTDKITTLGEIDKISIDVADFHTYALKKFLEEMYSENAVLDEETVVKMANFFEEEMFNYDFKYIGLDNVNVKFSEFFDYSTVKKMLSVSRAGYDISEFILNNPKFRLADIKTSLIKTKSENIDNNMLFLIEKSETFEDFQQNYLDFVKEELADIRTQKTFDEYLYLRIFADVYLSSFECWVEFFDTLGADSKNSCCTFDSKNECKCWWCRVKKKAKEIWKEVKPHVTADAIGAGLGAAGGAALGGIGAIPGALGGGCLNSAGSILGDLF
ncbi:MAG: hypothetical protein FWE63_07105 [Bacteroidales bacterium]|nr:hypothetical protein [Bacteroidales bacterium]